MQLFTPQKKIDRLKTYLLSFFLLISLFINPLNASVNKSISFLCLNDFHAAIEPVKAHWIDGAPMIGGASCIAGYVRQYKEKDPFLNFVVAGDMFLGHYIDSITRGKSIIEFFNMVPPDCSILGNHEFDYGIDILHKRINEADFPIICANLKTGSGKPFILPYLVQDSNGLKVLYIGIICEKLLQIISVERLNKKIQVIDPVQAILAITKKVDRDKNIDSTVILSHSGLFEDRRIAESLPEESGVDVIIGGHSHDLMEKPELVNGILICQAGAKGHHLGYLKCEVDTKQKKIQEYSWKLIPTLCNKITIDTQIESWLKKILKDIEPQMQEVIGELEGEWNRDQNASEWAVANFATDAIAEEMGVEIGIYNRGGIRKSLSSPYIKLRDIYEIFPFGNYMVHFKLTGKQLKTLLEQHLTFSGEYLFFSQAFRYTFNRKRPEGERTIQVTIHGKPLDQNRLYTIATVEYLWGHSKEYFSLSQEEIKRNGGINELNDVLERDIFLKNIKRHKKIHQILDGRIKEEVD